VQTNLLIPELNGVVSWDNENGFDLTTTIRLPTGREVSFQSLVTQTNGDAFDWFAGELQKHLAGKHDQSTHGNGHNASVRRLNSGSGLTAREIFNISGKKIDSQVKKVYSAENLCAPQEQRKLPAPICPKRADFANVSEYSAAYDNYSKEWDKWSQESSRLLVSPLAQQCLDGSNKGIKKYFEAVTSSAWFQDKFGSNNPFGSPKFSTPASKTFAGQYSYGFKGGSPYSTFKIDKGMALHEPTILHEIAHYATAMSSVSEFEGHGKEFTRNHLDLIRQVMGDQPADRLEGIYGAVGVQIAN